MKAFGNCKVEKRHRGNVQIIIVTLRFQGFECGPCGTLQRRPPSSSGTKIVHVYSPTKRLSSRFRENSLLGWIKEYTQIGDDDGRSLVNLIWNTPYIQNNTRLKPQYTDRHILCTRLLDRADVKASPSLINKAYTYLYHLFYNENTIDCGCLLLLLSGLFVEFDCIMNRTRAIYLRGRREDRIYQ